MVSFIFRLRLRSLKRSGEGAAARSLVSFILKIYKLLIKQMLARSTEVERTRRSLESRKWRVEILESGERREEEESGEET